MRLEEILKTTGGRLVSGDPDLEVRPSDISTDSRTIGKGALFVAIKGANFDGHSFVEEALKKGAVGAIVSKWERAERLANIIQVKDTTRAYGDIARYHRMRFDIPLIGVTGSNGKTTVKEMIWAILSARYKTLKNEGTENNHIGVPRTLLELTAAHEAAVLEIGMNHKGEIRYLGGIARPTAGVITNIGASHLEFLGGLEDVYLEKRELLEGLAPNGPAVLNGDDEFLSKIKSGRFKILTFGFGKGLDFRATDASSTADGARFTLNNRYDFRLKLFGRHNIYNALAAIAAASAFGVPAEEAIEPLASHETCPMRLKRGEVGGVEIWDDSYNSNPLSMGCAIEVLRDRVANGKKILVAGDMLELGAKTRVFHRRVGETVAKSGIDVLFTLGELTKETSEAARRSGMNGSSVQHFGTREELAARLRGLARPGDVVLIKGSRAMKMEEVIKCFTA